MKDIWWKNGLLTIFTSVLMIPSAYAEEAASPVSQTRSASSQQNEAVVTVGPAGKTLVSHETVTTIGPGIELKRFERFDARGWLNGEIMFIDLSNKSISSDLLFPGVVSAAQPLSEMVKKEGAVAGINGDFFDITSTMAPVGMALKGGELLKGLQSGRTLTAGVDQQGAGKIVNMLLEGKVKLPDGDYAMAAFNHYTVPQNGIGLYTSLWGRAQRSTSGSSVYEVMVQEGKVTALSDQPGKGEIAENAFVLVGREEGASKLKKLSIGDSVTVAYAPKVSEGAEMKFAVGGNIQLVKNGQVPAQLNDTESAPRTAIGFSEDGKTMVLAAVDGRQINSRGMTYKELGVLMKEHGAYSSLNLDGGGSTTMVARKPGEKEAEVVNQPSDGAERSVPNGIGIFAEAGSGKLTSFAVETVSGQKNSDRVFPGLTRTFAGLGHDEHYFPVDVQSITWKALPNDAGSFEKAGVFRAEKPGTAVAQAQVQSAKGSMELTVLGDLDRIETDAARLGMEIGRETSFSVTGYDQDGYSAPIEAADVQLTYDTAVVKITKNQDGSFTAVPIKEGASTLVSVTVQNKKTYLPVTIGLEEKLVSDFENSDQWSASIYPAAVKASLKSVDGKEGKGVQLNYDFSTTTATRAAYLKAAQSLELPGNPQKIGLWVNGDGNGAWLRTVIQDKANTKYTLTLASKVDWTGWKYVEADVPAGVRYPVTLQQIYPVETVKQDQYQGSLIFDHLTVKVPPKIEVPKPTKSLDPLIVQNGEIEKNRWKFAVLADSQFVAKSPNSPQVKMARESLRQIVKEKPDFLVINGDLVDTAWEEDFALAEQILKEEVGDQIPVYYIPGNHEIMGPGTLDNFLKMNEKNRHSFDHKGTRFLLLDSSTGSYRTSDFQQLIDLKRSLEEAAQNPVVQNVVVMAHHPTRDPLPTKNSQLGDRKEAGLLEQWLTEFRQESGGKGALYVGGHAHTVNVERVEGVPYMIVGSAGKAPYGAADAGGFYEWTMFGVDQTAMPDQAAGAEKAAETSRASGAKWIQAEVRPLLNSITLDVPEKVLVGDTVNVEATGHQPGSLNFPLGYPATVRWEGSENLFIGTGKQLDQAERSGKYTAVFNPETNTLTAFSTGEVTLKVTSNQTSSQQIIHIQ